MNCRVMLIVGVVSSLSVTAKADLPHAAAIAALTKCSVIKEDDARLSCYDASEAALNTALASHDLIVMDREAVRQTRRGLFGFTLPKTPLFSGDDVRDSPTEMDTVVTSASALGNGEWRMRMDNGSVWQNTESIEWKSPKSGSRIHLRSGAFGSYFMTIDGDIAVRAMRVG